MEGQLWRSAERMSSSTAWSSIVEGTLVPLRKPGPKRSSATERELRLKDEISELRGDSESAKLQLRLARDRLALRRTVAGLCDELLAELRQVTASADPDEVRELLRDVAAEVDERRYSWPD